MINYYTKKHLFYKTSGIGAKKKIILVR